MTDLIGLDVAAEAARPSAWVPRDEFVHDEPVEWFGDSEGEAEVQTAHGVGVGQGGGLEGAGTQHDVDPVPVPGRGRLESVALYDAHQARHRIGVVVRGDARSGAETTADLDR